MAAEMTVTPFHPTFRLYGQIKTADREVADDRLQCLLKTDGVILNMLLRSASERQMLNCWLRVPVHVVEEFSPVTCHQLNNTKIHS